ncbi:MAG: mannose-1-phosphate guanylyltransferase/mannose-6-phosphate isomerase [Proteobacteria bacterium]|nr:mannose-1-phosphate guanylyltransferase/mannose-6-phosphate isomerase [Pseudomonadota bacterium]MBI3498487.1 mannose-1-phosphate guanylyltransferase/mannose-6-phosphate isomerase [Pseudomonadota bacterium]
MIDPVILSGGSGTRLWPMSRAQYPKQMLPLVGELSLLQQTAARFADAKRFGPPLIVCNAEHRFVVAEQLRQIGQPPTATLLEPEGRNSAPAVAVAALALQQRNPEAVMLVLPSDHLIRAPEALLAAIETALPAAVEGRIVTFGIRPARPDTGYGYVREGSAIAGLAECRSVESFVEKPDRKTAEKFLAAGGYYWNSGMFLMSARSYLDELARLEPAMLAACREALAHAKRDLDFVRLDAAAFAEAPAKSIDYAVMEHTTLAAVVPVDPGWSDIGSWSALDEVSPKDASGNAVIGDVQVIEARNSYLRSNGRLLVAVGVDDLIVIVEPDAVLVLAKKAAQSVKVAVDLLKAAGRAETMSHPVVWRPWGHYQSIDAGPGFQVKRIVVTPGGRLSLQRHRHRSEHWVVVAGTAWVTRGEETAALGTNESIHIAVGMTHRLENRGLEPLHLIEVQSGSYVGEDDIVRLDDVYGRA